jgi:hypothetical protein
MKFNQKLAQRLFLCATPLVTSSLFVALPGFSATLATSQATLQLSNFSHNPSSTDPAKDTVTQKIGNDDQVTGQANADANFNVNSSNPYQTTLSNTSLSQVEGNGIDYSGTASSTSRVIGYNFQVNAGETFSFNFQGLLDLKTSIDSDFESANAVGNIVFQLYDNSDLQNPPVLIDFLTINGSLNSDNSDFLADPLLNPIKSDRVVFNPNETISKTSFGGKQESATTSFQGRFSQLFERTTSLVLRAFETNSASAEASCPSR